jgi:hypothetical protein
MDEVFNTQGLLLTTLPQFNTSEPLDLFFSLLFVNISNSTPQSTQIYHIFVYQAVSAFRPPPKCRPCPRAPRQAMPTGTYLFLILISYLSTQQQSPYDPSINKHILLCFLAIPLPTAHRIDTVHSHQRYHCFGRFLFSTSQFMAPHFSPMTLLLPSCYIWPKSIISPTTSMLRLDHPRHQGLPSLSNLSYFNPGSIA